MFNKKGKCKDKTRKILATEKKSVMKETIEHLKTLREAIAEKKVA